MSEQNEKDERNLKDEIERRVQYQMRHTWLNSINVIQKDSFLNNFGEEDKLVGLILLDMLLFHNQTQEKQLISTLIRKLQSTIYKQEHPLQEETSSDINIFLQNEMKETCFIPIIDDSPADSSNAWTALIREKTQNKVDFYNVEDLPILLAMNKRHIVFYDDMLGTGNQFKTYLENKRFKIKGKNEKSISMLMDCNPKVHFYYLCMAAYDEGICTIKQKWCTLNIIAAETFYESDSVVSKDNEYWKFYSEEIRDVIIQKMETYLRKAKAHNRFSKNLPVVFERNRPANTAYPLYWCQSSKWNALIAREGN